MATNADAAGAEMSDDNVSETLPAPVSDPKTASPDPIDTASSAEPGVLDAAAEPDAADVTTAAAEDYDEAAVDEESITNAKAASSVLMRWRTPRRLAAVVGSVALAVVTALAGWLGFQDYQTHQVQQQRELFLAIGRQGALNLTNIDWQHADADIQRVMDSATGDFYEDFAKRSKPFVDVVKKAQSKSVGTVTQAGLESASADQAQVLVAVRMDTSNLGAAEQEPRFWRMRLSVEKVGDEAKVSKVTFVP